MVLTLAAGSLGAMALKQLPAQETRMIAATPTINATYYATRNWALPTATRTPWPYIPPCRPDYCELIEGGDEYQKILLDRVEVWRPWVEKYNGPDRWNQYGLVKTEIPVNLVLAIMLKESRGKSAATGCAAEIGLFQIVPGDAASVKISSDCPKRVYGIPNFPERPLASEMRQGHKNIQMALVILDDFYEEAGLYLDELADFCGPDGLCGRGWNGAQGYIATAMFQCGPRGLRDEICYSRGGFNYADDVWECWMPFVTPDRVAPPKATLTPTPTLYSGEYRSPGLSALATAMSITATEDFSSTPTLTPTTEVIASPEEVVDKRPTFVALTILLALFAGLFVTVRDWKRLGERNDD